jgi:CheY-like chemotaxis protein
MKILLAEDDQLTRFMMSEMLDELQYDFDVCGNGEECLDLVKLAPAEYAMILMDVHMPLRTGVEATVAIRREAQNPPASIPIIAVTADHSWQDPKRAHDVGFTDVLAKPVTLASLKSQIETILQD